jgi:putative endonuclease
MNWYVYILECADGTYYTGVTTELKRREAEHNGVNGAKYTRARQPVRMVYVEEHLGRSLAQKREAEIKKLTRQAKQNLIKH